MKFVSFFFKIEIFAPLCPPPSSKPVVAIALSPLSFLGNSECVNRDYIISVPISSCIEKRYLMKSNSTRMELK